MSSTSSKEMKGAVERTAKKAVYSPLMDRVTRLGFGVRGLIYFVMGLLALNFALGNGGGPADQQGAIAALGKQPGGIIILWIILVGLAAYALWGVIRAVFDPLRKGNDLKGVLTRIGFLISGLSYAYLMVPTYGLLKGSSSATQGSSSTSQTVASILTKPWGPWLVGLIGLVILGVGLYQIYQGINTSFDKQFSHYQMTAEQVRWALRLGRFGTAARGFVFALLGLSIFLAAIHLSSGQSIGINQALTSLYRQPFGVWLLGIVAIGLMAFGVYSFMSAVWFRMKK